MTKKELIKALQEAPFGDDAVVCIGHHFEYGIVIDANAQLEISRISVFDENELTIDVIPDPFLPYSEQLS